MCSKGQLFLEKFTEHLLENYLLKCSKVELNLTKNSLSKLISLYRVEYLSLSFEDPILTTLSYFLNRFSSLIAFMEQPVSDLKFVVISNDDSVCFRSNHCAILNRHLNEKDRCFFIESYQQQKAFGERKIHRKKSFIESFFHFVAQCALNNNCRQIRSFVLGVYGGFNIFSTSAIPKTDTEISDVVFFEKFDAFVRQTLKHFVDDFKKNTFFETYEAARNMIGLSLEDCNLDRCDMGGSNSNFLSGGMEIVVGCSEKCSQPSCEDANCQYYPDSNASMDSSVFRKLNCTSLSMANELPRSIGFVKEGSNLSFVTVVLQVTIKHHNISVFVCLFFQTGTESFAFNGFLFDVRNDIT